MNPKYPIYVISKGRAKRCLTSRELELMKVPYFLVVEPQEEKDYRRIVSLGRIITTPFSNLKQGSIPVRNFVLEMSQAMGDDRHWILDDNIEGFHRLHNNMKPKVTSGTIFRCAEDFTDRYENVGLSGFNYYSFCKTTDAVPPFYLNTRIYSCILVNNNIPFKWRGIYNEDTDLSIRVLKSGLCTILFNAFLAGKVTTQRMKGGNTDEIYSTTNNRLEFAKSLENQHPDIVKTVWKFNRWHHQVDYSIFKENKLIKKCPDKTYPKIDNYGMKLVDT